MPSSPWRDTSRWPWTAQACSRRRRRRWHKWRSDNGNDGVSGGERLCELGHIGGSKKEREGGHCQINFCRARSAERNTRSRCGNRISALIRRLGSEDPERRARDEMALKVEGVVNGGMHAEEALGG